MSTSTTASKGIRKNPIFVPIVAVCATSLFILLLVIGYVYRSRISASAIRNNTGTTGQYNQTRKRSLWKRLFTSGTTPLHISHPVPVMQEDNSNDQYNAEQDALASPDKLVSQPTIRISAISSDPRQERASVVTVHIAEDINNSSTSLEMPENRRRTLRNSAVHPAEFAAKSFATTAAATLPTTPTTSNRQSSTLSPHQSSAALMTKRRQRSRTLDSAAFERSAITRWILIQNDTKTRPPSSYDDSDIRMSVYPTTPSDPGHATLTRAVTPVQTRRGTWAASRPRE